MATAVSRSGGPSSMPGKMCVCRSIIVLLRFTILIIVILVSPLGERDPVQDYTQNPAVGILQKGLNLLGHGVGYSTVADYQDGAVYLACQYSCISYRHRWRSVTENIIVFPPQLCQ